MNKEKYNGKEDDMKDDALNNEPESSVDQGENVVNDENDKDDEGKDIEDLKAELSEKSKQCEEYYSKLLRAAAEFDNFKKRTLKEKESLYSEAVSDVISEFLPVIDSIDRAIETCSSVEGSDGSIKEGVEMVKRQIEEVMKKINVEEIKSVGGEFDPELHNAVMHVEDDQYGQNEVVEEFQKGYRFKDRVIRYSMVKVAN